MDTIVESDPDDFPLEEVIDDDLALFNDPSDLEFNTASSQTNRVRQRRANDKIKCHLCGETFATVDGYSNHLKAHIFRDLCETAPGKRRVLEVCRTKSREVLQHVLTPKCHSGKSPSVAEVRVELLGLSETELGAFVDLISTELWGCVTPSTTVKMFHSSFTKRLLELLGGDKLQGVLEHLEDTLNRRFSREVLQWFLTAFVRELAEHLEAFYLKVIREPRAFLYENFTPDRDNPEDSDFQQTVYYVGGSVLRSIIAVAMQSKSSEVWRKISICIETKLLSGNSAGKPSENVTMWTSCVDRGGLMYISDTLWAFLMALTGVLKEKEERDGRVKHAIVKKAVDEDETLSLLWKEVVQDFLSEEESWRLLQHVCQYFGNAWGRGVALRRKNAVSEITKDKAALRPTLLNK